MSLILTRNAQFAPISYNKTRMAGLLLQAIQKGRIFFPSDNNLPTKSLPSSSSTTSSTTSSSFTVRILPQSQSSHCTITSLSSPSRPPILFLPILTRLLPMLLRLFKQFYVQNSHVSFRHVHTIIIPIAYSKIYFHLFILMNRSIAFFSVNIHSMD